MVSISGYYFLIKNIEDDFSDIENYDNKVKIFSSSFLFSCSISFFNTSNTTL